MASESYAVNVRAGRRRLEEGPAGASNPGSPRKQARTSGKKFFEILVDPLWEIVVTRTNLW
jgi:hypothetical protein